MSDGATTSAPARRVGDARRSTRRGRVRSLSTSTSPRAVVGERAAVAVVGVLAEADVGPQRQLGHLALEARRARARRGPSGSARRRRRDPCSPVCRTGSPPGTPSPASSRHSVDEHVHAQAAAAGHGRDVLAHAFSVARQTAARRTAPATGAFRAPVAAWHRTGEDAAGAWSESSHGCSSSCEVPRKRLCQSFGRRRRCDDVGWRAQHCKRLGRRRADGRQGHPARKTTQRAAQHAGE